MVGALVHATGSGAPILETAFALRDALPVGLILRVIETAGVGGRFAARVFPVGQ